MNSKLKKTGKIALIIVTPTVIVLLFLLSLWIYKKYKKKPNKQEAKINIDEIKIENTQSSPPTV